MFQTTNQLWLVDDDRLSNYPLKKNTLGSIIYRSWESNVVVKLKDCGYCVAGLSSSTPQGFGA